MNYKHVTCNNTHTNKLPTFKKDDDEFRWGNHTLLAFAAILIFYIFFISL